MLETVPLHYIFIILAKNLFPAQHYELHPCQHQALHNLPAAAGCARRGCVLSLSAEMPTSYKYWSWSCSGPSQAPVGNGKNPKQSLLLCAHLTPLVRARFLLLSCLWLLITFSIIGILIESQSKTLQPYVLSLVLNLLLLRTNENRPCKLCPTGDNLHQNLGEICFQQSLKNTHSSDTVRITLRTIKYIQLMDRFSLEKCGPILAV